jgi:hypothetical protein
MAAAVSPVEANIPHSLCNVGTNQTDDIYISVQRLLQAAKGRAAECPPPYNPTACSKPSRTSHVVLVKSLQSL